MSKLTGKVAIVTGASKGIGAAIARRFGAEGAAVVVNYASGKDGADRVVADIRTAGGRAIAVQGDVAKAADIVRLFDEATQAFGPADVLVNNAGVFAFGALEAVTETELQREFGINVFGTILATREAAARFGPGGGSVINISSVVGANPPPNSVIYSATKGAIDNVTKSLATELGPRGIRVNAISPGGTETEGTHAAGIMGSDFERQLIASTPLGRLGRPDDVAAVAVFLASDDAGWVSGTNIAAAGGYR